MAYVLKEHRFAIHIFMFQRGKAQFYLRMAFSEGQWPLRYFHRLLLSRFFCLRKGISDLLMQQAWKFSTCCHSHCGNPFCWKGHSSPIDLYNSRKRAQLQGLHKKGKQAGTWERRVEGGEGKASGGREKLYVPTLLHHSTQRAMMMLSGMLEVVDKALSAPGPAWVA